MLQRVSCHTYYHTFLILWLYFQATPKPILTLLDLSFPLASSDLGAENLENEFIMNNMHLHRVCICSDFLTVAKKSREFMLIDSFAVCWICIQIQSTIEEMEAAGEDTSLLDDEAFNTDAALDRCILRLIASCCNGQFSVKLDAASLQYLSILLFHYVFFIWYCFFPFSYQVIS